MISHPKIDSLPDRDQLDSIYRQFNRRDLVYPDPLVFLYNYPDIRDREIVGLVSSSLAYGRVKQILSSVEKILRLMQPSPYAFIKTAKVKDFRRVFAGFKHRFTDENDIASLMAGMKKTIEKYASLGECFSKGFHKKHENIIPALEFFIDNLMSGFEAESSYLLPHPSKGSACKRLNLYLRWMIRKDDVDPGGWKEVPPSALLIPLDTHMYKIGFGLGMTKRKSADIKTVREITDAFARINSEDPVRYDFALTRFGIRDELDIKKLLSKQ